VARKLPQRPGGSGLPKRPQKPTPEKAAQESPPPAPAPAPKKPSPGPKAKSKKKPAKTGARVRFTAPKLPWMKWLKATFVIAATLGLLTLAVGGYLWMRARASLPTYSGTATLPGLSSTVDVVRGPHGVPHLRGGDIRDLSRAMGYVHAQDRLFQMELARRIGAGRLAELFGAPAIEQDRLARRSALRETAEAELRRTSPLGVELLEAYAGGVNAYMQERASDLSLEFELLELEPEPWTAVDCLTVAKWLSYLLSSNAEAELMRGQLVDAVGLEDAYLLTGLALPPEALRSAHAASYPLNIARADRMPAYIHTGGSNAWAVDATRSASGRPLLAADPHMSLSMPSVFYEIRLSGDDLEVAGASVPGLPFVLFGQNQRVAWGVTALLADVQDIYIETTNPDDPSQYAWDDGWADFDVSTATIVVKDAAPVTESIELSRHGVVVGAAADGRKLTKKWDAIWNGDHVTALVNLNRAASWEEFTDALRGWSSPALAFVYADVEGNIGFFPAGEVPVRVGFDGAIPVDGRSGAHEWQGVIPHDLKSRAFNPENGVIVAANHDMFPEDAPYPLGVDALAPFRANRIQDLLEVGGRALTLDDFARIQQDRYDASTEPVLRYVVGLSPEGEQQSAALEALRVWDGRMEAGPAPLLYHALLGELLDNALGDELGELFDSYVAFVESGHRGGVHAILDSPESRFWDDRTTPEVEDRDHVFRESFRAAVEELADRFGNDVERWNWEDAHGVSFRHPMGTEGWLASLFNRGPTSFGGSTFTVANAKVSLRTPFQVDGGTSFRFLTDLADLNRARAVIPTGVSGHPLSPRYFDQNESWRSGAHHALLESAETSKLTLRP